MSILQVVDYYLHHLTTVNLHSLEAIHQEVLLDIQ